MKIQCRYRVKLFYGLVRKGSNNILDGIPNWLNLKNALVLLTKDEGTILGLPG
ncbi:hypothetical protein P872_02940 [Rhodonellum psychrophilum GCM71 = DSM 17998]|uniref:Uncharacterized protein n=1 Tax=Rhodonellum psychrophilum GCM71 = DSM 17998 TaxID=1123057 RepID=U5BSL1_9BACT|nr:hypothetical protein P872_02940 [Rhodonellum psychrophilum GCM71 = DSM 17998]